MENAIFDTSVWISYSKGVENPQAMMLDNYLKNFPDKVYITPTILQSSTIKNINEDRKPFN